MGEGVVFSVHGNLPNEAIQANRELEARALIQDDRGHKNKPLTVQLCVAAALLYPARASVMLYGLEKR